MKGKKPGQNNNNNLKFAGRTIIESSNVNQ